MKFKKTGAEKSTITREVSELNEKTGYEAIYFTSLTAQATYYSEQIISFGFSRNYLTGGVDVGVPWTKKDAQKIVFENVFIKNLQKLDYFEFEIRQNSKIEFEASKKSNFQHG